ncbi:hypothetical protein R3P38DRAFT_3290546 [Favolaschia claudopus]|uniref:Uncharacterized protein n=1 Tax=Favolaschia claudopus TaxID=2862362 RepID=A0AAV9ZSP6_9AGAR
MGRERVYEEEGDPRRQLIPSSTSSSEPLARQAGVHPWYTQRYRLGLPVMATIDADVVLVTVALPPSASDSHPAHLAHTYTHTPRPLPAALAGRVNAVLGRVVRHKVWRGEMQARSCDGGMDEEAMTDNVRVVVVPRACQFAFASMSQMRGGALVNGRGEVESQGGLLPRAALVKISREVKGTGAWGVGDVALVWNRLYSRGDHYVDVVIRGQWQKAMSLGSPGCSSASSAYTSGGGMRRLAGPEIHISSDFVDCRTLLKNSWVLFHGLDPPYIVLSWTQGIARRPSPPTYSSPSGPPVALSIGHVSGCTSLRAQTPWGLAGMEGTDRGLYDDEEERVYEEDGMCSACSFPFVKSSCGMMRWRTGHGGVVDETENKSRGCSWSMCAEEGGLSAGVEGDPAGFGWRISRGDVRRRVPAVVLVECDERLRRWESPRIRLSFHDEARLTSDADCRVKVKYMGVLDHRAEEEMWSGGGAKSDGKMRFHSLHFSLPTDIITSIRELQRWRAQGIGVWCKYRGGA